MNAGRLGAMDCLNWTSRVIELQEMAGNINRLERPDELLWGHALVQAPLIP
jgi:hypothetical protein